MSRKDRRAVTRASILLELVNRQSLTDRERRAALLYERDRETATGSSMSLSNYEGRIGGAGNGAGVMSRESEASVRLERVKGALPPSIRQMLGDIERVNTTRRGSLSSLPIKTGMAVEREHALVCVGALKTMLACLADAYRVPTESEAA